MSGNPQAVTNGPAPAAPARRRRWKRYVLLGVILLLVAGEIGARILTGTNSRFNVFTGASKEWDPYRRVRLRSNYHAADIHTNSKGMLGPEFEAKKPAGGYRIVVLGDSCSFIPAKRCYPRALEDILRKSRPGRPIEVVNASCPAYDSGQARTWYEREVDGYEHDMLIVYLGWNDMGQYQPEGLAYKLEETGYLKEPTLIQRALLNCYLLRGAYFALGHLERRRPFSVEPLSAKEAATYAGFYPQHFEDNLRAIIELARSRGRQVWMLNYASLVTESPTPGEQLRMHFPRGMGRRLPKYLALKDAYEKAFTKVAAETGTPVIDIESLFETPQAREVFTDSIHFNVAGAEKIAEKIAAEIEPAIK